MQQMLLRDIAEALLDTRDQMVKFARHKATVCVFITLQFGIIDKKQNILSVLYFMWHVKHSRVCFVRYPNTDKWVEKPGAVDIFKD